MATTASSLEGLLPQVGPSSQTGQSCWVGYFLIFSYWDGGRGWGSGREPLAPAGAESRCHQLVPLKGRREWEHRVGKIGNGAVCRMGH